MRTRTTTVRRRRDQRTRDKTHTMTMTLLLWLATLTRHLAHLPSRRAPKVCLLVQAASATSGDPVVPV